MPSHAEMRRVESSRAEPSRAESRRVEPCRVALGCAGSQRVASGFRYVVVLLCGSAQTKLRFTQLCAPHMYRAKDAQDLKDEIELLQLDVLVASISCTNAIRVNMDPDSLRTMHGAPGIR